MEITGKELEYKQLLHVDRSRMEEMLDTQPMRYMWAVEQSAMTDKIIRDITQKLEVVSAEVYSRLKDTLGSNGKALSEAAIKQLLPAEDDFAEVYKELTQAKFDAKILAGVVDAFSQRKTMLAKSVEREIMGIKADPVSSVKVLQCDGAASDAMKDGFVRRS